MDEKKERFEAYITLIDHMGDSLDCLFDEETSQEKKERVGIGILGMLWMIKLAFMIEIEELKDAQDSTETPQA